MARDVCDDEIQEVHFHLSAAMLLLAGQLAGPDADLRLGVRRIVEEMTMAQQHLHRLRTAMLQVQRDADR